MTKARKTKPVRERAAAAGRQGFLAALDIGSHKIACFIARPEPARPGADEHVLKVIGVGHQLSRGVRSGTLIDMDRAESAIRATVEAAEKMADVTVREVILNVACGLPESGSVRVESQIGGREIVDPDIRRLLNVARLEAERDGRTTIHTSPLSYTVDSASRIRDPRGMFGERLGALVSAVSVQDGPLRNLELCVESCHLDISGRVFSAYASGLAALVPDEMELGATIVDMGAGVTSIAVFADGALVHGSIVPLGGLSITTDIARGLSTPIAHAERLKTLHGSALVSQNDDRDMVSVPQVGEEDLDAETPVPRSMLTGIIRPRLEEILELVRDRLQASGVESTSGRRVVLTGGASQLTGAREMAQRILNKQTRLGRPIRVQGLSDAISGPAFATCAGLLGYARTAPVEAPVSAETGGSDSLRSPWMRWSQWLKDNL